MPAGWAAGDCEARRIDAAVFPVMMHMAEGRKLRPRKSEDNRALLKQLGL